MYPAGIRLGLEKGSPRMTSLAISHLVLVMFALAVGVLAGIWLERRWKRKRPITDNATTVSPLQSRLAIESLMFNLDGITADVREQVGQHRARIGAITHTIETATSNDSELVLNAGKELISANTRLEKDLAAAKAEIERQRNELQQSLTDARTDALTGLANRRAFDQEATRAVATERKRGTSLSLIIMDIDRFKSLNDQHGHMVGDHVLKTFAECLKGSFREFDLVARYGGEEFVALLPQTQLRDAILAAEQARIALSACNYSKHGIIKAVTASMGVAELVDDEQQADLIRRADSALYLAKRNGRNNCCYHDGYLIQKYTEGTDLKCVANVSVTNGSLRQTEVRNRQPDMTREEPSLVEVM